MAAFEAKTDRKQISLVLNLIRKDCVDLYKTFRAVKTRLNHAIGLYEEFMTDELNTMFQCNNSFSDIVLNHRKHFQTFLDGTSTKIVNDTVPHQNGTCEDNIDVLFISLQEWLTQGPKGQQFYFMIDISSFKYTTNMQNQCNGNVSQKV